MTIEHDLKTKKLEKQMASKDIELYKVQQLLKIGEIEQQTREQALIAKKEQLEAEILELQHDHRQKAFKTTQKMQEINEAEINALTTGNQAVTNNLKEEINKLQTLNTTKTEEINRLLQEIKINR